MNYENINNSNLDGMSLASFCQSRAVLLSHLLLSHIAIFRFVHEEGMR